MRFGLFPAASMFAGDSMILGMIESPVSYCLTIPFNSAGRGSAGHIIAQTLHSTANVGTLPAMDERTRGRRPARSDGVYVTLL
jgi:hypothetical protein